MRKSCILRELCPPEKFANKQFGSLVTSTFSVSNNLNWVTPTHLKMCVFGGGSVGACIWFDYAHHASAVLQTHGAGCLQTQMAADPGGTTPYGNNQNTDIISHCVKSSAAATEVCATRACGLPPHPTSPTRIGQIPRFVNTFNS